MNDADFVRAVYFLIDRDDLAGPVNLSSPHPLPNAEFMRVLREAAGVRWGLPSSAWVVEVGAWLLRTESELILKSRRVVPGRLVRAGFTFEFSRWHEAAGDLCRRWRALRGGGKPA
jgi:NAD dependent epimerase/dehydratase family enzyme